MNIIVLFQTCAIWVFNDADLARGNKEKRVPGRNLDNSPSHSELLKYKGKVILMWYIEKWRHLKLKSLNLVPAVPRLC